VPRLLIASTATATPMGAEVYQAQVSSRAPAALSALGDDWTVARLVARSLRSPLPGDRRVPMGLMSRAGFRVRGMAGAFVYPAADLVHRMNLELPPGPRVNSMTLHDVVSWRFGDESAPVPAAAEEARRADAVICVSQFSADEAHSLLGVAHPHVVHNGVDTRFFDALPLRQDQLAQLGLTRPYVLSVGGASRRKNLEGLAAAWPGIHSARPDLVLALAGPEHPRRTGLFKDLPGVRLLGRVADDLLPGLVAGARAVVVPSLYEGFGLPALEAMAAQVPLVAARTSALPEVVGDGGILVAPTPDDIAQGTLWAVSGDSEVDATVARGRARAGGFTWERSAEEHARVWASLV